jgi:hypothetical protein
LQTQALIERLRENIPTEIEHENRQDHLREYAQFLLILPIAVIIIFSCSHLALFTAPAPVAAQSISGLSAEYGPWKYFAINGLRAGIINEIRADNADD